MAIPVPLNSPEWVCIGASGIRGGCSTSCAGGDTPTCSVPQRGIAELAYGDCVGRVPWNVYGFAVALDADRAQVVLRTYLQRMAGTLGLQFFEHFMRGGGQTRRYDPGSAVSRLIRDTEEFRNAVQGVRDQLAERLRRPSGAAASYDLELAEVPWLDFWRAVPQRMSAADILRAIQAVGTVGASGVIGRPTATSTLAALIGGTKGCKVFVRNLRSDGESQGFSLDLRFRVCDHFGVDASDLYDPGLVSLWLLQHAYGGTQRPFVNVVYLEERLERVAAGPAGRPPTMNVPVARPPRAGS